MQSINCSLFSETPPRFREIEIFGKKLRIKNTICSPDGKSYREKSNPRQLQLSVCPTSYCPASCPFCIAKGTKMQQTIDLSRFRSVMERLKAEDLVRGVKITGGEPFMDPILLNEVICTLYEIFGFELELSISTNGINLSEIGSIRYLRYMEAIHISRHHYDDERNRAYFGGADVPDGETLKQIIGSVPYADLFVLNCMLLKGGIDSAQEAHRFLDFAMEIGASKVGFMTCMPINTYARENRILYESVICAGDPALLFTRGYHDYEFCHCQDGVYSSADGGIIEFYGRCTIAQDCAYCRGLVYGADNHLRTGFDGEILL